MGRRGYQELGEEQITESVYRGHVNGTDLCTSYAGKGPCVKVQVGQRCRYEHPATEAVRVAQRADALVSHNEAPRKETQAQKPRLTVLTAIKRGIEGGRSRRI